MIKKCIYFCIILTCLLFTLTGCYDSTGIEDFHYIVAMGIDNSEKTAISLSVQTAKATGSSKSSSSQSNEYKIYTVDCESIEGGINILNNYLNKKINLSHCSAIVFSEEIAKQGVRDHVNVLGNDTEIRPDCNLIISSKTAYDVLSKVSNSGENFSSRLYEYILTSVDYTGYTVNSTFSDFFSRINNRQTQATAIYALANEDTIQNSGAALFKDDVMIGTISPSQTIAHLIVTNELDSCMISIDNPFDKGSVIDLNLRMTKRPHINVELINNTPFINVNVSVDGSINSSSEEFDYGFPENIKIIEKATSEYLEILIDEYLYSISKDFNSDIAGFGGILSGKFMTLDGLNKVHWNEIFKDSFFEVNVYTTITSSHLFNKD